MAQRKQAAGTATGETSTKIACTFPNAHFKAMLKLAKDRDMTLSSLIRDFVESGLSRHGVMPKNAVPIKSRSPAGSVLEKTKAAVSSRQTTRTPAQKRIAREKAAAKRAPAKKAARKKAS